MKKFLYGFFTAVLILLASKEVIFYKSLQFVDQTCGVKNDVFSCDDTKHSLFHDIQYQVVRPYMGDPLTGRCNKQASIDYFGCDKFQVWLGEHFAKERGNGKR